MLQFVRYLVRGYKWSLLLIFVVGVAQIASALVGIYLSKQIIDIATGYRDGSWHIYALVMAGMLALSAVLRLVSLSLTNRTAVRMGNAIRSKIFGHLLYTQWQSLKGVHSGDMLTRIIRDTDDVVALLTHSLPSALISGLQLLASLGMLYYYAPLLALVLGLGMPLVLIFGKVFYRRMVAFSREIKGIDSRITAHMQEALSNQAVIRSFERQAQQITELELAQTQLYQAIRKRVGLTMYGNLMTHAAFSGGYFVAFVWGAWGLMRGTIVFGTMTTFLQLVTRIQRPMNDLLSIIPSIIATRVSIDRLVDVLAFQTERLEQSRPLSGHVALEIEEMSFRYDKDAPKLFEHFALVAQPNSMIAIMGQTGSGKTTLIRLLLGLIQPSSGVIVLRSGNERIAVSEATRSNFVYVPQGNSLVSGTIRDNLLVGDDRADDHRLAEVLRMASADFVFDLPNGLDTELSERGVGLSEGQAQRIAIARALLRPGRILLLDEATSALDIDTERAFLGQLRQHLDGRIVLFITHHAEVAEACDQVVRL